MRKAAILEEVNKKLVAKTHAGKIGGRGRSYGHGRTEDQIVQQGDLPQGPPGQYCSVFPWGSPWRNSWARFDRKGAEAEAHRDGIAISSMDINPDIIQAMAFFKAE